MRSAIDRKFLPQVTVVARPRGRGGAPGRLSPFLASLSAAGGRPTAYVCREQAAPASTPQPTCSPRLSSGRQRPQTASPDALHAPAPGCSLPPPAWPHSALAQDCIVTGPRPGGRAPPCCEAVCLIRSALASPGSPPPCSVESSSAAACFSAATSIARWRRRWLRSRRSLLWPCSSSRSSVERAANRYRARRSSAGSIARKTSPPRCAPCPRPPGPNSARAERASPRMPAFARWCASSSVWARMGEGWRGTSTTRAGAG